MVAKVQQLKTYEIFFDGALEYSMELFWGSVMYEGLSPSLWSQNNSLLNIVRKHEIHYTDKFCSY